MGGERGRMRKREGGRERGRRRKEEREREDIPWFSTGILSSKSV
jgi:hypothetical protein